MNNENQDDRQKLEALLRKAAASQDLGPPDDALSKLLEEFRLSQPASEETAPQHSLSFKEFLAFVKERQNRKSS